MLKIRNTFQFIVVVLYILVSACSFSKSAGSDDALEEEAENNLSSGDEVETPSNHTKKKPRKTDLDKINLRLAQLWTRLDDLELRVNQTIESQKVLEKSLLLGITPKSVSSNGFSSGDAQENTQSADIASVPKESPPPQIERANENSLEDFESSFAQALSYYRSGDFGKAVVELNQLKKIFGDQVKEGIHLYWLGKSWISLNDFSAAERYIKDYIDKFPASPLIPRAKLDLARAKYRGGKAKQAVSLLKGIIDDYPEEDVAEMARLELERQRRN